jgi:hypothetical protein
LLLLLLLLQQQLLLLMPLLRTSVTDMQGYTAPAMKPHTTAAQGSM